MLVNGTTYMVNGRTHMWHSKQKYKIQIVFIHHFQIYIFAIFSIYTSYKIHIYFIPSIDGIVPVVWSSDVNRLLIGKVPDAGKDWGHDWAMKSPWCWERLRAWLGNKFDLIKLKIHSKRNHWQKDNLLNEREYLQMILPTKA